MRWDELSEAIRTAAGGVVESLVQGTAAAGDWFAETAQSITGWMVATAALITLALLWWWPPPIDARVARRSDRPLPGWLRGRPDAPPLARRLSQAALPGVAVVFVLLRAGPDTAGQVGETPVGPMVALMPVIALAGGTVVALAGAVALGWLEPAATKRARQRRIADAPQALDLLASCLAAGLPVRAALRSVVEVVDGPLGDDLGQVLRLTDLGHDDVSAWRSLAGHQELGPAALDLARSVETGALLVESLLVHAEVAREERRGQVESAARRVGVRSVLPLMVCFIPSFLLIGIVPTVASAVLNALHF
ncbi:MAG: type II secretion system F family protein [Microlunatus sp.]